MSRRSTTRKRVAGGDEQPGVARPGCHGAVGPGARFEGAQDGGADGDDPAATGAGGGDGGGGGLGHLAPFGVHEVARGVLGLDRGEGAGADMERDEAAPDPGRIQAGEQFLGQVQRGGGCRDRTVAAGEHGLVVGRHRGCRRPSAAGCRAASGMAPAARIASSRASPASAKSRRTLPSSSLPATVAAKPGCELDRVALAQALARLRQRPPGGIADPLDQRDLDRHLAAPAEEAGRQDAGVVEDQEIPRAQKRRQVAHHRLAQWPAVHQEQPRCVARPDRRLRDQLGRQLEIEQVDAHGAPVAGQA